MRILGNHLTIIALLLLIQVSAYGAFENVDYGARSLGMGSAYISVADDASAVFWNTSGIARIEQNELEMSYMELYYLVSYGSLSYAQRIKGGSVGLGVISSSDSDGVYQEMELVACYGRKFFNNLSVGSGVKYLSSGANTGNVNIGNGKGVAIDFGCQYQLMNNAITFGMRLRNLVGYVAYNRKAIMDIAGEKYSQMPDFSYGFGVSVSIDRLFPIMKDTILAVEIADNDIHTGLEYTFRDILSIRAGYRLGNELNRAITAGFGVKASAIRLDYAYVSSFVGAATSQFSVSVVW
jgi:hypothetical protein